jgi:hypothetical protein
MGVVRTRPQLSWTTIARRIKANQRAREVGFKVAAAAMRSRAAAAAFFFEPASADALTELDMLSRLLLINLSC